MPVLLFPSEAWVDAWVAAANADAAFRDAGRGWAGSVGAVFGADELMPAGPVFLRLDGEEGRWDGHALGTEANLLDGAVFTLSASYRIWKLIMSGELDPLRGLVQGRVRVRGQLSSLLGRISALNAMMRLAGTLDTTYLGDSA